VFEFACFTVSLLLQPHERRDLTALGGSQNALVTPKMASACVAAQRPIEVMRRIPDAH
jgi:hypothetical protein